MKAKQLIAYDIDFYATDIAFDGESIWLCDRENAKIKKLNNP